MVLKHFSHFFFVNSHQIVVKMLQNRRVSFPYLSTKNRHLWAQKLVSRTFRTVLRTKRLKNVEKHKKARIKARRPKSLI